MMMQKVFILILIMILFLYGTVKFYIDILVSCKMLYLITMQCYFLPNKVCDVVDRVLKHPVGGELMKDLHPEFVAPTRPFLRMPYKDAIQYLKDNGITKEDGTLYEFGEVSLVVVQ